MSQVELARFDHIGTYVENEIKACNKSQSKKNVFKTPPYLLMEQQRAKHIPREHNLFF